jgi:hypothetical protein
MGLSFVETSDVRAVVETWTIDPELSTLTLSARVNQTFTATAQAIGGNITHYSGTFSADRTVDGLNTRITISGGNVIDAIANPAAPFQPATGNVVGIEDNYGMQANLLGATYQAVVRDLRFDITGGPALINRPGSFSFDPTAGSLNHEFNNSGETFQFLEGLPASVSRSFSPVTLTTEGGITRLTIPVVLDYTVALTAFNVVLLANFTGQIVGTRGVTGDYSGDNTVGPEDYLVWQNTYGSMTNLAADGNHDGIIDASDYVLWRNQLGQTFPGGGAAAAVPEPTAIVLLSMGWAMWISRKFF